MKIIEPLTLNWIKFKLSKCINKYIFNKFDVLGLNKKDHNTLYNNLSIKLNVKYTF